MPGFHCLVLDYTLPPTAALEKFMRESGVSSKQTDKARQAFMRSAKQAGFFMHGEDRLVRPAGPGTKPIDKNVGDKGTSKDTSLSPEGKTGGGGGGSGDLSHLHPFIQGLLQALPEPASQWSADARAKWLQTAANIFDLLYKGEGGIEIKAALAPRSPRPNE